MLSLCVIVPDWYVIYNNQEENSDNICKLSLSMLLLQITENIGYSIRKQDLINALNLGRSIEAFIMIICFQKSDIYIYSALYRILQVQDMVLISDGYFVTLMFFFSHEIILERITQAMIGLTILSCIRSPLLNY
jgi:hypothetical protein